MKFQFHKGTIKTYHPSFGEALIFDFNSIKVRLKLNINGNVQYVLTFQFHKGTIKTQFSFHTVREFYPISIP